MTKVLGSLQNIWHMSVDPHLPLWNMPYNYMLISSVNMSANRSYIYILVCFQTFPKLKEVFMCEHNQLFGFSLDEINERILRKIVNIGL